MWVNFYDLPEATRDALWEKHGVKVGFSGGIRRMFSRKRKKTILNKPLRRVYVEPDCRIDSTIIRLLKINTVSARTCPPTFGSQGSQAILPDERDARVMR